MMDDNGLWRMMDDDGNDDGSDDRNNDGSDDGNDDGNGDGSDDGNDDGNDGGNDGGNYGGNGMAFFGLFVGQKHQQRSRGFVLAGNKFRGNPMEEIQNDVHISSWNVF
jgi:hypothetical protein